MWTNMKIFCKKLILFTAVLSMTAAVAAQDNAPIMIRAKSTSTDFGKAKEFFEKNEPGLVYPLVKLTPEQLSKVPSLTDINRFSKARKTEKQEEYHYTLDSAAEQAQKELAKLNEAQTVAKKEKATAVQPGNASFYVSAHGGGITFMFYNTTRANATIEIILEPLSSGRFGNQGVHLRYRQNDSRSDVRILGWRYNTGGVRLRPDVQLMVGGAMISRLTISWGDFYNLIGESPYNAGRSTQWKLGVYRWADENSSTLRGLPYENADTYLILPMFTQKNVADYKRNMIHAAITKFYYVDQKKGNATRSYLDYVAGQRRALAFYKERFRVIHRIGYPLSFSEYYLAVLPRIVPKEIPDDETKTKELNFRYLEWQEDMELLGNFLKARSGDSMFQNAMMRYDYEKFSDPEGEFEKLRMEAVRDRFFTEKFLEEE